LMKKNIHLRIIRQVNDSERGDEKTLFRSIFKEAKASKFT
jgi:hypothetical protein